MKAKIKQWVVGTIGGALSSLLCFLLPVILIVAAIGALVSGKSDATYNASAQGGSYLSGFINMLVSQYGATTSSGHRSVYADYYGHNGEYWGAWYISWCARKAGIAPELIPDTGSPTPEAFGCSAETRTNLAQMDVGDLVFFDFNRDGSSDGVGVVTMKSGYTLVAIAGDVNGQYLSMCDPTTGNLTSTPHKTENTYVSGLKIAVNTQADATRILSYAHIFTPQALNSTVGLGGDKTIVEVAEGEYGGPDSIGGEKYWRWWGFEERQPWCAIFLSWCADQCGYVNKNICPSFAGVDVGVQWFQNRGLWHTRQYYTPSPGDYVFYDWDHDGRADHVELVTEVSGNTYTSIGGNTGNAPGQIGYHTNRSISSLDVYGYGSPKYTEMHWPTPTLLHIKGVRIVEHAGLVQVFVGSYNDTTTTYDVEAAASGTVTDVQYNSYTGQYNITIDHSATPSLNGVETVYSGVISPPAGIVNMVNHPGTTAEVIEGERIGSTYRGGYTLRVLVNGTCVNPFSGTSWDGVPTTKPFFSTDGLVFEEAP